MTDSLGSKWLTLVSLACKFLVGALIVFLPRFLADADVFGDYATWMSLVAIASYVLDLGVSLKALVIPRASSELRRNLVSLVAARDFWGLLIALVASGVLDSTIVIALFASIFGASSFGCQAISRSAGDYLSELYINALQLVVTIVFGLAVYVLEVRPSVDEALAGFILLPRLLAMVFSLRLYILNSVGFSGFFQLGKLCKLFRSAQAPVFAAQGVIVAASANLDVLLASFFLPVVVVGEIKIINTVIGIFLVIPEMAANFKLNRVVNSGEGAARRSYWRLFVGLAVGLSLAAFISFVGMRDFSSVTLIAGVGVVFSFSVVVLLRVLSIGLANYLTVENRQGVRVYAMLFINVVYWSSVAALCHFFGGQGFVYALLFSSACQAMVYGFLVKRHG